MSKIYFRAQTPRGHLLKVQTCLLLVCASLNFACHASGIDLTVQNNSTVPLRNVEVDYPGAAFGAGTILPGRSYWYHIKPLADGEIAVSFEQSDGSTLRRKGPRVRAGVRGSLILTLNQDRSRQWHLDVEQK